MTMTERRLPTMRAAMLAAALAPGCGGAASTVTSHTALCAKASGNICTVAGTGLAGDGADLQPALATQLYLPQDMTMGPDGLLYIVDWNNHRIRVIQADGNVRIVAGIGELGQNVDDPSTDRLNHPTNVTFDPSGLMVIAAWHNSRVKTVDPTLPEPGNIVNICGTGKRGFGGNGGPAAVATLDLPVAVVFDANQDLLIADQANQMIRKVDHVTTIIQTIAGTGHCADAVNAAPCVLNDEGPALQAGFHFPIGQAAVPGGRIALDALGDIFVADTEDFRVRMIDTNGIVHTFAGVGVDGFAGDGGPATAAQLSRVSDVAVMADGTVLIADTENSCVRAVSPFGIITTFAGSCGPEGGFAGDGGPATAALLDRPYGVEVAPSGDVYIADTHNQRVRVVYR